MSLKNIRLFGNGIMQLAEEAIGRQLNAIALSLLPGSCLDPDIIRVTFPLYIVNVFLETCGGAICGAGKELLTMLIILVSAHRRAEAHHGEISGAGQRRLGIPVHLNLHVIVPCYFIKPTVGCRERSEVSWGDTRLGA